MNLLRIIVIGTFGLALAMLVVGYVLGSSKIYEQKKKVKEKEKKEKKLVNQDVVLALQSLGFKKQESIIASQKAVEKLGEAETEKLIKEALKQI